MGYDDGSHVVFFGDVLDEFVDEDGGLGIESGVWLVAEEVVGGVYDGAGDAYTFFHTTADFGWHFLVYVFEAYTFEYGVYTVELFGGLHFRKYVEREHDVLLYVLGVEEGAALEEHSHFTTYFDFCYAVASIERAVVVVYFAFVGRGEAYDAFKQYAFAGAAGADDEVRLTFLKGSAYVVQYEFIVERFRDSVEPYHFERRS